MIESKPEDASDGPVVVPVIVLRVQTLLAFFNKSFVMVSLLTRDFTPVFVLCCFLIISDVAENDDGLFLLPAAADMESDT